LNDGATTKNTLSRYSKHSNNKGTSDDLKARRKNTPPALIGIADRCLKRLNTKGNRLLIAGKHPNKVKVACAREMVGFFGHLVRALQA